MLAFLDGVDVGVMDRAFTRSGGPTISRAQHLKKIKFKVNHFTTFQIKYPTVLPFSQFLPIVEANLEELKN